MAQLTMTVTGRIRRKRSNDEISARRGLGAFVQFLIFLGGLTIGIDLCVFFPSRQLRTLFRPPASTSLIPVNSLQSSSTTMAAAAAAAPPPPPASDGMGRERVVEMLQAAGADVASDPSVVQQLPTWQQVVDQIGDTPLIHGLDTCEPFRAAVPEVRRMLGAAGMFSTGTNLVTQLLKLNCAIPARVAQYGPHATKEQYGMRWQVPWGKHTPAHYKHQHAATKATAIAKDDILPIVTIRNPWRWMQSMCKHPYTARWPHHTICPHLFDEAKQDWNPVTVKYGAGNETYQSLVHLYNDWYQQYLDADYPRLVIRMEDLIFRPEATLRPVCECAGGRLHPEFRHVHESAKSDSPGHDTSVGMVQAWIKYGQPLQPHAGFGPDDYARATDVLVLAHTPWRTEFRYPPPPSIAADDAAAAATTR